MWKTYIFLKKFLCKLKKIFEIRKIEKCGDHVLRKYRVDMWHFISKGVIRSKWSYCQEINKHLRPVPSPTVENSLSNRHLNLKNEKSENFKMLRNCNFNIFFLKKGISSSCM